MTIDWSRAMRIELTIIGIWSLAAWFIAPLLSRQMSLSTGLSMACALLLLQGLVRDLSIQHRAKRQAVTHPRKTGRYLCVESTVGILGIVIAVMLIGTRIDVVLWLDPSSIALLVGVTMLAGFFGRDWVIQASPWRIFRDPDHINVIVSWRR